MSMECNKDEAVRAKEIAERKLSSQDYQGALKFAQKAQQLFPALENVGQMFAVIEVHIAAQAKVNGTETDWYGILQVPPQADDLLIKKQYRKLALLLHPDKNKFAGAEAAFKLIGEASQILSDKQKRQVHDAKRTPAVKTSQRAKATHHRQSHAHQPNGQPYANRQQPRVPSQNLLPTFWTACPSCHMRFQYLRTYENQNLLCAQCRNPFIATDIYFTQGNGAYNAYSWTPVYPQQHQAFNQSSSQPFAPGFNPANNFPAGSKMKTPHTDAVNTGANTTNFPAMGQTKSGTEYVQQTHQESQQASHDKESVEMADPEQKMRRERKDDVRKDKEVEKELRRIEREQQKKAKADLKAQEAMIKLMMKRKEQEEKASTKVKRRRLKKHHSDSSDDEDDEDDSLDDILSDEQGMDATLESKLRPRRSSRVRRNVTYKMDASDDEDAQGKGGMEDDDEKASVIGKANDKAEKGSQNGDASADTKLKEKLAELVKSRIRMNLKLQGEKSTSSMPDLEFQAAKAHDSLNEGMGVSVSGVNTRSHLDAPEERGSDKEEESKDEMDEMLEEPEQFSVPDADFHDFDKDREEKDVKPGQIWAAYDEQDGMPRYYFRVKDVQSCIPFKVTICWLELQNLSEEQEELKALGFCFACGNSFKNSTSQVIDSVNMLSHIVQWEKGPKGMVRIYPREKDVWALYRDWDPALEFMKGDVPLKYDMVEVVTGFSEQTGIKVALLDKMSGFKTLFNKRTEGSVLEIPAEELSRFSHQVPAHTMQGDEAPGIPKGCWELDPASVPSDLIVLGPNEENSNQ